MLHRAVIDGDRRPGFLVVAAIGFQHLFQMRAAHAERTGQGLVREGIGHIRLDARAGAAGDDRDRGGGGDGDLVREALHDAIFLGILAGAALFRQLARGSVGLLLHMLEDGAVPHLGHHTFPRHAIGLQEGMEAHHAQAHRAFAHRRIAGALHAVGRGADEVAQHVVEEAQAILDQMRIVLPIVEIFQIERRQAADRRALLAVMVDAGGQRDLAAQVRGFDPQAGQLVMLGQGAVHMVDIDDIGLAGLDAGGEDTHPERTRRHGFLHRAVMRAAQFPDIVLLHGAHEGIRDQQAVMQVERLAVRVAAGRAADFDEFLDLRVIHRQIDRRRATAQRTLADRQGEAVHHADERDDARGLAILPDLLADRAQVAPIAADAAAARRQPDILVPQPDNAIQAVGRFVEEAGNRQAAVGAAIRQHRGGRHEPELGNVIIHALAMRRVVGIMAGHAGKEVLVAFAGQQVAVVERRLAEIGQQAVALAVHLDANATFSLQRVQHGWYPFKVLRGPMQNRSPRTECDCNVCWSGQH